MSKDLIQRLKDGAKPRHEFSDIMVQAASVIEKMGYMLRRAEARAKPRSRIGSLFSLTLVFLLGFGTADLMIPAYRALGW